VLGDALQAFLAPGSPYALIKYKTFGPVKVLTGKGI
jgi:hypothetical protein